MLLDVLFLSLFATTSLALNFGFEDVQLTEAETSDYPAIRFGGSGNPAPREDCRVIPGDANWPDDEDWAQFNETLGGVLLKPVPLATPCYSGPLYDAARCEQLKRGWSNIATQYVVIGYHGREINLMMLMECSSNDPTSIMSQWASGNTCVPTSQPDSNCTQGGYPVYVVEALNVRHVQMAVNFARNNNIRLVIRQVDIFF